MNMIRINDFNLAQETASTKVSYCLQVQNGEHWSTLRSLTPQAGTASVRERKLQRQMFRWQMSNYFGTDQFRIITLPYQEPLLNR